MSPRVNLSPHHPDCQTVVALYTDLEACLRATTKDPKGGKTPLRELLKEHENKETFSDWGGIWSVIHIRNRIAHRRVHGLNGRPDHLVTPVEVDRAIRTLITALDEVLLICPDSVRDRVAADLLTIRNRYIVGKQPESLTAVTEATPANRRRGSRSIISGENSAKAQDKPRTKARRNGLRDIAVSGSSPMFELLERDGRLFLRSGTPSPTDEVVRFTVLPLPQYALKKSLKTQQLRQLHEMFNSLIEKNGENVNPILCSRHDPLGLSYTFFYAGEEAFTLLLDDVLHTQPTTQYLLLSMLSRLYLQVERLRSDSLYVPADDRKTADAFVDMICKIKYKSDRTLTEQARDAVFLKKAQQIL